MDIKNSDLECFISLILKSINKDVEMMSKEQIVVRLKFLEIYFIQSKLLSILEEELGITTTL